MAKGSRNKTNKVKDQLTVSASASNSASNKIGSALAAVDNLVKDDNGLVLGAMAEKLKFAKKSYDVAEEEKKRQASESFGSEIEALVGELKKLIEDNKRLEAENRQSASRSKQLEESVENLKKKINFDKKELGAFKFVPLLKNKKN